MRLAKQLTVFLLIAYVGSTQSQRQWIRQLSTGKSQPIAPVDTSSNVSNFLRTMQERTNQKSQINPMTERPSAQRPSMPSMPTMPMVSTDNRQQQEIAAPRMSSNLHLFQKQQRELADRLSQHQANLDQQRMVREEQERGRERQQQESLENHRLMMDAHRRQMDSRQQENEEHTQQIFADQQNSFQDQQKTLQEQLQAQRDTQRDQEKSQMAIDMGNMEVDSRIAKPIGKARMMSDDFNDGKVSSEQAEKDADIRRVDSERLQNEQEQRQVEREQRQREKDSEAESVLKWNDHQNDLQARLEQQQANLEEQRMNRESAAKEREAQHRNDLEEQRMAMDNHRIELENHRREEDARLMDRDRQAQDDSKARQEEMRQRLRDQEDSMREREAQQKEAEMEQREQDMNRNSRIAGKTDDFVPKIDLACGSEGKECQNSGSCETSKNGTRVCVCNKPWTGLHCELVWKNPCTEHNLRASDVSQFPDPWNRNNYIICTDINIYHSLPCAPGTYFNELYGQCTKLGHNPRICPLNHCKNDANCITTDQNEFECECKLGFAGQFCEINTDECIVQNGNEKCGQEGKCIDQLNGYYCKCANNFIGLDCEKESSIKNPCTNEAIEASRDLFVVPDELEGRTYLQCTSENQFVVSKCSVGLFWHQEDMACTHERPTVKSGMCMNYPCHNGGECSDLNGTEFTCLCKGGYTGELCETMIDSCASNPCQNSGRCLAFAGGYTCACADKIIDECCCHGLKNPCPQTSMIIPGLNNYYPHLFPDRYIHCDFDGRAFSRKCSSGLKWSQRSLSCLPDSFVLSNPMEVKIKKDDLVIEEEPAEVELLKMETTEEIEGTTTMRMMMTSTELLETSTENVFETSTVSDAAAARRRVLMDKMHTKNLRFTRPSYQWSTGQ